jgi:hypothetical protein
VTRLGGRDAGEPADVAGWRIVRVFGVPDEGFDVEITATRGDIDLTLVDETSGLPPAAARVAAARPPSATTTQDGDLTLALRHIRL